MLFVLRDDDDDDDNNSDANNDDDDDDDMQVRCTLTEHEMPLKPEIIQAYASCKRYERLLSFYTSPYYQKYKQFFINCNSKKRKYVMC